MSVISMKTSCRQLDAVLRQTASSARWVVSQATEHLVGLTEKLPEFVPWPNAPTAKHPTNATLIKNDMFLSFIENRQTP